MQALPLADLTVLDLTIARAGPTAVRQLADWGADVIRIESPLAGFTADRAAGQHHAAGQHRPSPDELNIHRNKRSIVIDLSGEPGRALLHQMAKQADVLIENMRPAVKTKLGFDWETLSAINPRLILGSISGFGQTGDYSDRGGVDQIAQGMGGMMAVTGLPGQGPVRAGVAISDVTAGLQLAVGVLTALHERERTGLGRWVHTSLLESMLAMLDFQAARWTVAGDDPQQSGNDHPTLSPMGTYQTADGFVNIAASGGRLWEKFCDAAGLADLPTDTRFATATDRYKNRTELNELITQRLQAAPTAHWVESLNAAGVPCGPVNTVAQAFADPQVEHLQMAAPVTHPTAGEVKILRNATQLEGVANNIRTHSPLKGEHTKEILTQFGVSETEQANLLSTGVVVAAEAALD